MDCARSSQTICGTQGRQMSSLLWRTLWHWDDCAEGIFEIKSDVIPVSIQVASFFSSVGFIGVCLGLSIKCFTCDHWQMKTFCPCYFITVSNVINIVESVKNLWASLTCKLSNVICTKCQWFLFWKFGRMLAVRPWFLNCPNHQNILWLKKSAC